MLRESGAAAAEYDATYVGNLPAHDTTGRLDEWFEDNFTALPNHVRVHAPGVREGTAPTSVWFYGTPRLQHWAAARRRARPLPHGLAPPSNLGGPRRRRYARATAAAMAVTAAMVAAVATAVMTRSAAAGRVRCRLLSPHSAASRRSNCRRRNAGRDNYMLARSTHMHRDSWCCWSGSK